MMPLSMAVIGEKKRVIKVGGKDEVRRFLQNLGFVEGVEITVVSELSGNMIINVKDTRIAIDKSMANRIMVYKLQGDVKMRTLRDAKVGETVRISKLRGEGAVKRRIMDMGITKGTDVFVRKLAPLGDPVEISVRGYELSIRKSDAEMIEVN